MNNLTTRKIVLGLLMALVLALGVRGIADAQTVTKVSGNNQTKTAARAGQTVSIKFEVSNVSADTPDATISLGTTLSGFTLNSLSGLSGTDLTVKNRTYTVTYKTTADVAEGSYAIGPIGGGSQFTVHVVEDAQPTHDTLVFMEPDSDLGYYTRGQSGVIQIDDRLIHEAGGPLRYAASSGTLYVQDGSSAGDSISTNEIISSEAPVYLRMSSNTSVVSVYVEGHSKDSQSAKLTVVYRYAQFSKESGDSPKQLGSPGSRLRNPFVVRVTDAGGNGVPGHIVVFRSVTGSGTFSAHSDFPDDTALGNIPRGSPQTFLSSSKTIAQVTTDSRGYASVFLILSQAVPHSVTAQIPPLSVGISEVPAAFQVTFTAEALSDASASTLTKVAETDGQSANKYNRLEKPLTVVVRDQGDNPIEGVLVTFNDRSGGALSFRSTDPGSTGSGDDTNDSRRRLIDTNENGEASIRYRPRKGTGAQTVSASISDGGYQEVLFTVNGTPSTNQQQNQNQQNQQSATNTITISPSSTTGDPGETETISVTSSPTGVLVTLSSTEFANTLFSPQSGLTPFTSTLTLPSSTRSYSFFAFGSINNATVSDSATVTVATTAPGSLTIEALGAPANGSQAVRVTVRESDGTLKSDDLSVTLTGPGISRSVETVGGTGAAAVTVPTATTSYTLTASATGYTSGQITLSATTGQTGGSTPPPAGPVGVADSIEIDGSRQLSGTVDQAMRLRVRVLDANDNGVSDVRVTFRVLAPGRGTFAGARGNGRAVADQTDRNGYASANLTPSDDGDIIVRASAAGVSADVTFIIDVGEASADTETPTPSRDVTPSRDISPVVHVGVASRPPMLWVDGGAIYALVGASAQKFAPSVDNALNITVADGKVYWTEMTGESGGTINSANLDGTGVTELASIFATPIGIAVDTDGSKLYWTNSRGRIQSANLNGSGITNELQDLPSPMDLALGNGNVYWTQGNGSVRFVNLRGQRIVRDISTGSDTPGSLVIGGGKVYWTEKTGDSSGTVNSANLNGTGATQLASIRAVPMGIAVDGARSKLYWSNSRGRIQSADLDGSGITNVVSGLGSPGDMVLSNSITAPAATTATSTTTASRSKYDVNGDGTVDRFDALLVVSAFGTSNNKYDVNGDGTVNVKDYDLVFDEIVDAASAPPIVGIKLSAVQIDRIQEQIDLLIATNDRSPAAMRTLIYLQQLIVTARPEKTQLLANYPNPFNPETWIPYELATDTDVRLTIYNTQGVVIRTLQLGHQSAGYYTGRDRAAYWDGRNALGEQVASGLYFYQLETDEMSLMRKMVILK